MAPKQFFFFLISKSPWAHFLHVKSQKVINYREPCPRSFFISILVLSIQSLKKIVRAVFAKIAKKCYFGPNLPLLGPKWGRGLFFKNLFQTLFIISGFLTSCQISRKSLERFSGKKCYGRTSEHPDKSNFIGPFPVNRRPKNLNIVKNLYSKKRLLC